MKYEKINFKYENRFDNFKVIENTNTPIYYFKNLYIGNLNGNEIILDKKYFLMANVDQYFHFLKEYFGSYLYIKNHLIDEINYLFINNKMEKDIDGTNFVDKVIQSVKKYIETQPGEFVEEDIFKNNYLKINELYIAFDHGSSLIQYNKHFKHNGMPDIVKELRKFYSYAMVEDKASPKKIFITRRLSSSSQDYLIKLARSRVFRYYDKHINDALEDFFEEIGYEIIELSGMEIEDQIKYFYNATHVAGPLGTGFFNGIFSKPGTRFISVNRNPRYFFDFEGEIKSVIDCEFYYNQLEEHPDYNKFKESLDRIINKEIC